MEHATVGFLVNASCTSTFFLIIVQSSLRSISKRSWYIRESSAKSGFWRITFGIFLSVSLRFLRNLVAEAGVIGKTEVR